MVHLSPASAARHWEDANHRASLWWTKMATEGTAKTTVDSRLPWVEAVPVPGQGSPAGEQANKSHVAEEACQRAWSRKTGDQDPTCSLLDIANSPPLASTRASPYLSAPAFVFSAAAAKQGSVSAASRPRACPEIKIQTRRLLPPLPSKAPLSDSAPCLATCPQPLPHPSHSTLLDHHGGRRAGTYSTLLPRFACACVTPPCCLLSPGRRASSGPLALFRQNQY